MKKTRIIVAVVAAALMIMGVGYAAWSQTLTVNANGAIGSFDVAINSIASTSDTRTDQPIVSISDDRTSATVTSKKLFAPGITDQFIVTIKNNGSIPATLSSPVISGLEGYKSGLLTITAVPNSTSDVLASGGSASYTVTIAMNSNVTEFPKGDGTYSFTITTDSQQRVR